MRYFTIIVLLVLVPVFVMAQASGGQIRRTNKSNAHRVDGSNMKPSIETSNPAKQSRAKIPLFKVISERDKTCELIATETDACISRMTKGKYVIPSKVRGFTVISIGYNAFRNCNLESIIIPNTIKSIDDEAFRGCKSLKTIIIPDQIEYIGNKAFMECHSLTKVSLPSNLKNINP